MPQRVRLPALPARLLADEYDAAQERGEVKTVGNPSIVPDGNNRASVADLGLTRKEVHDTRMREKAAGHRPGQKPAAGQRKAAGPDLNTPAGFRPSWGFSVASEVTALVPHDTARMPLEFLFSPCTIRRPDRVSQTLPSLPQPITGGSIMDDSIDTTRRRRRGWNPDALDVRQLAALYETYTQAYLAFIGLINRPISDGELERLACRELGVLTNRRRFIAAHCQRRQPTDETEAGLLAEILVQESESAEDWDLAARAIATVEALRQVRAA